jgi:PAS domain S-box-containing protein
MAVSSKTQSLWVVDDSPLDGEFVRRALAEGHDVSVFTDAAVALEHLAGSAAPPDLLILDWQMPGLTGLEVCQFLRAPDSRHAHLPILVITARQSADDVATALAAGANDFLSKPYSDVELRARVAALVRTHELIAQLEQAESTIRSFFAHAPDALLAISQAGVVLSANEEAGRVFGSPAGALVGRRFTQLVPELASDDLLAVPEEFSRRLPDVRVKGKTLAPTVRRSPTGVALSFHDVTGQRSAEAERLDLYSVIAHDLRTPLNALLLRCKTIERGKYGLLPPGLLADLQKMDAGVRSMVSMVNDFLDLARLQGSSETLDIAELDIVQLVEKTLEDVRPLAEAAHIALAHEVVTDQRRVLGDRKRLGQVLANLLSNAIKFTGSGGAVVVRVGGDAEQAEIAVRDNGPGIPKDVIPILFDRFTRAPGTSVGGTGLGLMIVRQVVEAHGGRAWVESAEGVGSTFWFRVPRARGAAKRSAARAPATA